MIDKRPQADRILIAEIWGRSGARARWRELSGDEEAAAVAALRELAGGRADLLAEVAGVMEGAAEGEMDEPLARQAAGLCRAAGADPEAIPGWVAEGWRRGANAGRPPFSAPKRTRPPGPGQGKMSVAWRVAGHTFVPGGCSAFAVRLPPDAEAAQQQVTNQARVGGAPRAPPAAAYMLSVCTGMPALTKTARSSPPTGAAER